MLGYVYSQRTRGDRLYTCTSNYADNLLLAKLDKPENRFRKIIFQIVNLFFFSCTHSFFNTILVSGNLAMFEICGFLD